MRLILSGGAGSGKSTTVRALVRMRRERKRMWVRKARCAEKDKRLHVQHCCVLSAPTGTASFQMKNGATTAHRAWGVPIGFCGKLSRTGNAFKRLQAVTRYADIGIFDEFSMLGRAFVGKILFRVRDAQLKRTPQWWLAGMDALFAGHLAQAAQIGDEPLYQPGRYKGKGLNKPPDNYRGEKEGHKSLAELVEDARLFLSEFDDVAMLRNTHRVDDSGDPSWSPEVKAQYKQRADRFLEVTRKMADLEWTRGDHAWLAQRNKRALLASPDGRAMYAR